MLGADMNSERFPEPKSLEEATARRNELGILIENIQNQLSQPNKLDASGCRLTSEAYWDWKRRANMTRSLAVAELRSIKQYIGKQANKMRQQPKAGVHWRTLL